MSTNTWAAAAATLPPASIVAVWALRRAATSTPVGDENEYAGIVGGPSAAIPFCRMPAYGWLVRRCGSVSSARTLSATAAVLACSVTSAAAVTATASWAALLPIALLVLSAERALLSARLWPDALLASFHAALVLLLVVPEGSWVVPAAAVCTAIVLFRLDGIPLAAVIALSLRGTGWSAALVVVAPLAMVGALAVRARRRGHPLDTTTWFNVRVMSRGIQHRGEPLERSIDAVMSEWEHETIDERRAAAVAAVRSATHHPLRVLLGVLSRLLALAGADTFGRHRLAPSYRPPLGSVARASMSWGVPLLCVGAAAGAAVAPASLLAYVGCQWCLLAVVHTRTRYRAVLLPALTVLATFGLDALIDGTTRAWIGLGVGLLLAALARRVDLEAGSIRRAPTTLTP